jgi:hypothetical protein
MAPALLNVPRLSDWRTRLSVTLADITRAPFQWGAHDCGLGLAVPAVQALIGVDLGEPYRGKYTTAAGALKALRGQGFKDLRDLAASNFTELHPAFGRMGDLAAIKADATGWGLGVVIGARIIVLAPSGTATVDLLDATSIYLVG